MNSPKLKKQSISSEIQQNEELRSAVERGSEHLLAVLGNSAGLVEADWTTATDSRNRQLVRLKLSDFTGSVQADFAPDELDTDWHLADRLYSLWGDLLQRQSKQALRELHEAVHQLQCE
jgi:hypothetical protein